MPDMAVSGGRYVLPYTIQSSLDNTNVATLHTMNTFVARDIDIKLTLAPAAITVSASKQATSPTIARTNTTAGSATNVGNASATTTAPTSGYFISAQATAPETNFETNLDITKTINTSGFLGNGNQITASAVTSQKVGSIYYIPITSGIATGGSASATITIENTDDESKESKNVSSMITGTATTTEPSSGYFLRIKADGSGNSKVTTAGWFDSGSLTSSSSSITNFYQIAAASVTHSGGGISITSNYSGTPTVSASLTSQTTTGVNITTTQPSSGYYITIKSESSEITGKTKATRAAYKETFTQGYLPNKSSTNILSSSAVEPTVTISSASSTSYLTIPTATINGTANATATVTVAPGTVSISSNDTDLTNKTRINASVSTSSSNVSDFYIAIKASAAANSTGTTSSISGTVYAAVTSGYISGDTLTFSNSVSGTATAKTSKKDSSVYYIPLPSVSFTNAPGANETDNDYIDLDSTAPVLVSGSNLYIQEGYIKKSRISLSRLVPDSFENGIQFAPGGYILQGYAAFDQTGSPIIGTLSSYTGDYSYSTP